MKYPINSIFTTLQGEGVNTGTPVCLVRFQGCSLGCPWCDTKHAQMALDSDRRNLPAILEKGGRSTEHWASVDEIAIVQAIKETIGKKKITTILLTGGEPLEHDLGPLLKLFRGEKWDTDIETSGAFPLISQAPKAWVTASPKIQLDTFRPNFDILWRANELKFVIATRTDVNAALALIKEMTAHHQPPWELGLDFPIITVQPMWGSAAGLQTAIKAVEEHGWRLSLQTHKLIRLP